jgi:uncharacterized membrane protein
MAHAGEDEAKSPTTQIVERNIEALLVHRQACEQALGWQQRLAHRIARFAGNMSFVWLHAAFVALWTLLNLGIVPGIAPFDPTFVILATIASVEAIFISTFILITQNRMQAEADRRAELNLQISLLAEHEITRLIKMVTEIGDAMNISASRAPELYELKEDVKPEVVLDTLERREAELNGKRRRRR